MPQQAVAVFWLIFTVGIFAVTLATQVVVPAILRIISVLFRSPGPAESARAVRDAGANAIENMRRSRRWAASTNRAPAAAPLEDTAGEREGPGQVRIAHESAESRARVARAPGDDEVDDEAAAHADDQADARADVDTKR
jgi:hypothetical protein